MQPLCVAFQEEYKAPNIIWFMKGIHVFLSLHMRLNVYLIV